MNKIPPTYRRVAAMNGTQLMKELRLPQKAGVRAVILAEISIRLEKNNARR